MTILIVIVALVVMGVVTFLAWRLCRPHKGQRAAPRGSRDDRADLQLPPGPSLMSDADTVTRGFPAIRT